MSARCSFEGCVKPSSHVGLCNGHYRQRLTGQELKPLRPWRPTAEVLARDENGRKQCTSCKAWRPEADYHNATKTKDRLQSQCRDCNRSLGRFIRYGLTEQQYAALLKIQGGVCAICVQPPTARGFVVDHDHSCCAGLKSCGSCVRGLLCISCNSGIGLLGDSPQTLSSAIAYITRSKIGVVA